jgi:acyl carrier protein
MIQQIKDVLEQVTGRPGLAATLSDSANIIDDIGLTSLEMVDFMLHLEDRLNIEIQFHELDFASLRSIKLLSESLSKMQTHAENGDGDRATEPFVVQQSVNSPTLVGSEE